MNAGFFVELDKLCYEQAKRGYKPMWVFFRLKADFWLELAHVELIGKRLGFKSAWAQYRWAEIQEERQEREKAFLWEPLFREVWAAEKVRLAAEAAQAVEAERKRAEAEAEKAQAERKRAEQAEAAARRRSECPVERALTLFALEEPFTFQDLKRAYRRVAREAHPDAGGSHAAFLKVSESYENLKSLAVGAAR